MITWILLVLIALCAVAIEVLREQVSDLRGELEMKHRSSLFSWVREATIGETVFRVSDKTRAHEEMLNSLAAHLKGEFDHYPAGLRFVHKGKSIPRKSKK